MARLREWLGDSAAVSAVVQGDRPDAAALAALIASAKKLAERWPSLKQDQARAYLESLLRARHHPVRQHPDRDRRGPGHRGGVLGARWRAGAAINPHPRHHHPGDPRRASARRHGGEAARPRRRGRAPAGPEPDAAARARLRDPVIDWTAAPISRSKGSPRPRVWWPPTPPDCCG